MNRIYLVIALTIGLLATSCEKDDHVNTQDQEGIVGDWVWVKSQGGFSGNDLQTPEESGVEKLVRFYDNDTVEIWENDVLVHKTDYFLSREESTLFHDTFDFLTINYRYQMPDSDSMITLSMRYIIRGLSNTLLLSEDVYDGYGHVYTKE